MNIGKDFETEIAGEIKSDVSYMCNYSDSIWEEGYNEGLAEAYNKSRGIDR